MSKSEEFLHRSQRLLEQANPTLRQTSLHVGATQVVARLRSLEVVQPKYTLACSDRLFQEIDREPEFALGAVRDGERVLGLERLSVLETEHPSLRRKGFL